MIWSLVKWYALFNAVTLLGILFVLAWDWLNWRRLPWLRWKAERQRAPSCEAVDSTPFTVLAGSISPADALLTSSVAIPDWINTSPTTLSITTSSVNQPS